MPKLKTSKSVQKRIRFSKRGKIKHFRAGKSHLLTSKRGKRKRHLAKAGYVAEGDARAIRKLLPYGA
ncbi:MAG: 50S ribosomal protein L35 [Candidatus Omnitrophica bacterium]|nr:50S ribosomal protein L35 [Candidatus Omnitrophota bacterium]